MKKIAVLCSLGILLFSCQKEETKHKNLSIVPESKDIKEISSKNTDLTVTIDLPNNQYVSVGLDSFEDQDNSSGEILYKPKSVKVFDSKSKKEIQEKTLAGIFYSKDGDVWYGDFNFDGKMDIACKGIYSGYRDFYNYNIYLATTNGYILNKEFSKITEEAIATIVLDTQNKKITATREADWDETWIYEVKNSKPQEVRHTKDVNRHRPFYYHYDSNGSILEKTVVNYDDNFKVLSFKTIDEKKNILLFLDDDYSDTIFKLYYAEMINDSLVNSSYSDKFIYNKKNNTLQFEDNKSKYKIYENDSNFGIEITTKGKTTQLMGNPNSKKGNLSRIISLKRNQEENEDRDFENVVIENN